MKLCVILPVYNVEKYVLECLQSLSKQSFQDFVILAVNDCSTDRSGEILDQYAKKEPRLQVYHLPQNLGVFGSTNYAMDLVSKMDVEYVARMDSDDICLPFRFARQVTFLRKNPDIHVVGARMYLIDEKGNGNQVTAMPTTDADIKANMVVADGNISNPTSMWRNDFFQQHNIRFGETKVAGDFGQWVNCALNGAKFANIAEGLVKYRMHPTQLSSQKIEERFNIVQSVVVRYMTRLFPTLSAEQIFDLASICHGNPGALPRSQIMHAFELVEQVKQQQTSILGENRPLMFQHMQRRVDFWKRFI